MEGGGGGELREAIMGICRHSWGVKFYKLDGVI